MTDLGSFYGLTGFRLGGKIVVLIGFGMFSNPKKHPETLFNITENFCLNVGPDGRHHSPNPSLVNLLLYPLLSLCLGPREGSVSGPVCFRDPV